MEEGLLSFTSSPILFQLFLSVLYRIYQCCESHAVLGLYSGLRTYTGVFAAAEGSQHV